MDFYEDMPRWSFNLQVFFLNSRLRQLVEIQKGTETVIQDRTIYEDANIFAPNLHEMGLMSKRDFDNYYQFFQTLKTLVQPPDLLIYLNACLLYTSDAADERSSVDLGGRRIIKKKKKKNVDTKKKKKNKQ